MIPSHTDQSRDCDIPARLVAVKRVTRESSNCVRTSNQL